MQRIPLLTTKFQIARTRSNLIPRPRLFEQLNEGLQCKLAIISAPAGSGKTTLLSGWAERSKQNVAWVAIDEQDNDPVRFWAYVIGSLQKLQPGLGERALESLYESSKPPIEQVLTLLINDLASMLQEVALILDDYHTIDNEAIHNALSFLIEQMPAHIHLYLSGRFDPPLRLIRLRAYGEVITLSATDLRFTSQEATAFLGQIEGVKVTTEEIQEIFNYTEGWGVGLHFAALSLQERKSAGITARRQKGYHHYIADYLKSEVLDRQPPLLQSFLLRTSILDRLTGPLCDAITSEENSEEKLEELYERNLFVLPLEDERGGYRYQTMFSEVLRDRLQHLFPAEIQELHHRASRWYDDHGVARDAVAHLLRGGDIQKAVQLAEQSAERLLANNELSALLSWGKVFPNDLIESRPRLAMALAWASLLSGELDGAENYLNICRRFVEQETEDGLADITGHLATVGSFLEGLHRNAARATEITREREEGARYAAQRIDTGTDYPTSVVGLGREEVENPRRETRNNQRRFSIAQGLPQIARLQYRMGQLRTSAETYRQASQYLERGDVRSDADATAAVVYIGLGEIYYEWNDLDNAMRNLSDGLQLSKKEGDAKTICDAYSLLARVHQARGDLDGALDAFEEAERIVAPQGLPKIAEASLAADRVRIWLAGGNLQGAVNWLQQREIETTSTQENEKEQLILARVLIAQYRSDDALEIIASLVQTAASKGWNDLVIRALVLQALAFDQQGDAEQAISTLIRALVLAEPEGYSRLFIQEGMPLVRLLQKIREFDHGEESASKSGVSPHYLDTLLRGLGIGVLAPESTNGTKNGTDSPSKASVNAALLSPLSDREIEVLKLIAHGKSNSAIGDSLFISLSTVKTHINNLYSKLGVESRTQALMRAKEIHLI